MRSIIDDRLGGTFT